MSYYAALTAIKASILCQYLRFLVGPVIRPLCWGLLSIVVAYGIATVIGSLCACLPVPYFWDHSVAGGRCINLEAFWFTNATFNIISDVAICILPLPTLRKIRLPKRQKYGLMFVFAIGGG